MCFFASLPSPLAAIDKAASGFGIGFNLFAGALGALFGQFLLVFSCLRFDFFDCFIDAAQDIVALFAYMHHFLQPMKRDLNNLPGIVPFHDDVRLTGALRIFL